MYGRCRLPGLLRAPGCGKLAAGLAAGYSVARLSQALVEVGVSGAREKLTSEAQSRVPFSA